MNSFSMAKRHIISTVLFFLFSSMAQGKDHIFLVGGGNNPTNSQVQIEMNVKWIGNMLQDKGQALRIFFTDGQMQKADVVTYTASNKDKTTPLEPLARILGEYGDNYLSFRNHQLTNVEGGTGAENLTAVLKKAFTAMEPGDRVFFIYQGHGSWENDSSNNALLLWNNTHISAREFDELLDLLDPGVQFRFFFPQCYSGAFLRLADARALAYEGSMQARQCGFTAVSENDISEGCTVSIKEGDYRDYSTYFFAALDGKTRLGQPLNRSPDTDDDGKVSLHEAHLYSLDSAYSTDLSRSTSERFLEQWQPWYLKWRPDMSTIPNNFFGERVRRVAKNIGLSREGHELVASLFKHRNQLNKKVDQLHEKQAVVQSRSLELKEILKAGLLIHWPEASLSYTSSFKTFVDKRVDAALAWIDDQEEYPELVVTQDNSTSLEKDALDLQRQTTQIDKVFRMIRLSRILEQLKVYGNKDDMAAYESLLACEDSPL